MEEPPHETVLAGMRKMLWYLRQKYMEAKHGPKPVMAPHFYGIGDEKVELAPVYQQRIEAMIEAARETNELDLVQNGFSALPDSVHGLPGLTRLTVTAQHLHGPEGLPTFDHNLSNLKTLWLKRCELEGVHESMGLLRALTDLDVSDRSDKNMQPAFFRHSSLC